VATTTLDVLLDLTDRVQAAIDSGDWQQANALEVERRGKLEELVAGGGNSAEIAAILTDLRDRNYRLVGLVEHHRRRVLREATMVSTGHAGAARYAEAQNAD
jgi:predicted NBD/HSP70 family sugar kinase